MCFRNAPVSLKIASNDLVSRAKFGITMNPSTPTPAVPEPATFVLAGMSFFSLLVCARQRYRCQCDTCRAYDGFLGATDSCGSEKRLSGNLGLYRKAKHLSTTMRILFDGKRVI